MKYQVVHSPAVETPMSTNDRVTTGRTRHEAGGTWRILGRTRASFVKEMKQFANCPANIFYWEQDIRAREFAHDLEDVMREAGWNVTLDSEPKKTQGIRIITKSTALHADEIASVAAHLRAAGFDAKVRVRPEMETEAVQIAIGSSFTSTNPAPAATEH